MHVSQYRTEKKLSNENHRVPRYRLIVRRREKVKVIQKQVRKLLKEYKSKQTTVIEDQEEAYIASRPDMCPI